MRWAAPLACCAVLCLLVVADHATAQSVPEKPAISGTTPAAHDITVTWTAPSNTGGTAITAYDLRYVPSSTPDKDTDDAVWTVVQDVWVTGGGALSHQITGLRDSTSHDIQVRAVNSAGDGPWSDVSMAATIDNDREVGQLNSTYRVHIDFTAPNRNTIGDRDRFTFTVTEATRVWFYTTGPINSAIFLWRLHPTQSTAPLIYSTSSRWFEGLAGTSLEYTLQPGITYLLSIGSYNSRYIGPVDVHTSVLPTSTNDRTMAPELALGYPVKGNIAAPGGRDGESEHFKFVLDAPTDVWIVAYGHDRRVAGRPDYNMDTNIELQKEDGTVLAMGDDGGWTNALWTSDIRQTALAAGTYYVRVWGDDSNLGDHHGDYELIVKEFDPPGSTQATATPIHLNAYFPGAFSSATDKDYYSIIVDSPQWFDFFIAERGGNSFTDPTFGAKVYDPSGNEVPVSLTRQAGLSYDTVQSLARVSLLPGKNYIEVSTDKASGDYVILPVVNTALLALQTACPKGSQSDLLYTCQWHLNNTGQFSGGDGADINVEEVWATNKGEGVTIAIVDKGVQLNHEDLRENVGAGLSHDYHSLSIFEANSGHPHGTAVAGIAAARDNLWGVRGVAPRATIYSLNLARADSFFASDMIDVLTREAAVTGVSSNSWALTGAGKPLVPGIAWEMAAEQGATTGFGGKGIVYVHSGGNFHGNGDNANLNGLANFHTSVAVCAIGYNGRRAVYSERGASLWVCAPAAGITTTDTGNFYTRTFSGTSAAAPIVSGVVALIRAENPELTARDVKLILAGSARKNDPRSSGWAQAGVKYGSTSTRYNYSHDYGFGAVDAGAAVELAKTWAPLPTERTIDVTSETLNLAVGEARADGTAGTAVTSSLTLDPYVGFIEYIEVKVTFDHPSARDLQIQLRSPSGAVSTLAYAATRNQFRFLPGQPVEFPDAFRFGSARHVGENAAGAWTLTVTDRLRQNTGSLTSWSIKAYGHGATPEAPPTPTATSGMRSLTVDWDAPTNPDGLTITSYDLRYIRSSAADKTNPDNWTVATGIGTDDTGTYDITGLGPGVQYDVQVRALSNSRAGPWSESLVVRSSLEKPFVPSLTGVTPRDTGLGAAWNAPTEDGGSEITSYDLRTIRSDASQTDKDDPTNWDDTFSAWTTGGGDLRVRAANLTNGVEYDVQVRARNAIGVSDWSGTRKRTPAIQNTDPTFADDTATREVAENLRLGGNVGARISATDPDRDPLTYSIAGGHNLFEIEPVRGQLRVKAALDADAGTTSHTLTVEVSDMLNSSDDADPTIDDSIEVTVNVTGVNEPPLVEGTRAIAHVENEGRTLAGASYSATDPEGANVNWSVGGIDRGFFAISNGGVLSFANAPDFDTKGDRNRDNIYEVTVQATEEDDGDVQTLTGSLAVTVTLSNFDEPPEIDGPASVADYPENSPTTTVVGRRYTAMDPEGAGVTWSDLSGNDAADFDLSNDGVLTFKRSPNFEMKEEYSVMLNAFDGSLTGRLTVTVTIADVNEPPVVRRRMGTGAFSVVENSERDVGSFVAPDPEDRGVTWSLARSGDHGRFEIDANGSLSFKEAPDYESSDLGSDKAYTVTVRATEEDDGDTQTRELTGSLAVTVMVTDVNEPPTVMGSATPSVAENTTAVATYRATDPEGVTPTWSLQGGADVFTISNAGALAFTNPPNYEAQTQHTATVRASDGTNNVDQVVTVTVTDVNELEKLLLSARRPLIGEDYTASFEQGTGDVAQSPTWQWSRSTSRNSGHDAIIGATAATYVPVTADSGYFLRVTASYNDGHGQARKTLQATSDLATAATSASNMPPAFPSPLFAGGVTGLSVRENAGARTVVGVAPQATDPESGTLTYSLAVPGFTTDPPFEINPNSNSRQIRVASGAALNHEDKETYSVTVTAEDEFNATATATFDIAILDVNERPVAFPDPSVTTAEDMSVTFGVLGNDTDPDPGDTLTVSITTQPRSGRVVLDTNTQLLTYEPADNVFGTFTFTYTATDDDPDRRLSSLATLVTVTVTSVNDPPEFATEMTTRTVSEGARPGEAVGPKVAATDVDDTTLTYSLSGASDFVIDASGPTAGQIRVAPGVTLDRENTPSYQVTVTATDRANDSDTTAVTINLDNVNDPPVAENYTARTDEDVPLRNIEVVTDDTDPDTERARLRVSVQRQPLNGTARAESDQTITYTPNENFFAGPDHPDSFIYRVSDGTSVDDGSVSVTVEPVNDLPVFSSTLRVTFFVYELAGAGAMVGAVTASDVEDGEELTYSLDGADASAFEIGEQSGQITVASGTTFDIGMQETYMFTVEAEDKEFARATVDVEVKVTTDPVAPPPSGGGGGFVGGGFAGGGGGGGGGGGPSPSVVDFEWNVTRDIEDLDSGHDKPSGHWSDGTTLWVLENGSGADDAVYAYDLATGERVEDREFELDNTNRAPRGVWSDRTLLWVSDSGRNSLFAHDLESGERLPERDIALAARNRAARGIWSDDETMWVLDGGKDSVFAYDLASGALLAEYELASANGDPHGLWSDGVTVWVSDHGAKRLFAYRLPVPDAEEVDGEDLELERVRDEEFPNTVLSRASNNSPRGIWSDGDVMYVADESDGKVYTYNMPDAIDARLSSLTLSGVDIGEFSPNREEYEGVVDDGVTVTTVEAAAAQDDAVVVIDPPDADEDTDGRQVAVGGGAEITVTVTSADGSREQTYSVLFEETGPSASCLRGAVVEGFSLVVSEGGSIEDLVACAEGRGVTALYTLDGGEYVSYILGAPGLVNEGFAALFADGVPALTPLIAKSEGPPSPAPASDDVPEFGPDCLRGEIVEGFNLVLSEGGSIGDLEACAEGVGLAALYALDDGVWVSYIVGAPEFVNRSFRELFTDGVPVATPLVGKRD